MKKILRVRSKSNTKNSEVEFLTGVMPNLTIPDTFITRSIANTAINCKVIISTILTRGFTYKFANHLHLTRANIAVCIVLS